MSEVVEPQDFILTAAELRFKLRQQTRSRDPKAKETADQLLNIIKEHNMLEWYKATWSENQQQLDEGLIAEMQRKKEEHLKELQEKKEKAEKEEGDVEVLEIEVQKARYLSGTSNLDEALAAYLAIKNLTTGKNIDKYLAMLRLCLAWQNDVMYKKHAEETEKLIEKGGDWDRRNRFMVYNGVHHFRCRDFENAAKSFLDAIATFTASEIFDYKRLVYYTVVSSVVSLKRNEIQTKLVDNSDIRQVIDEMPELKEFLNAFYESRYRDFLKSLLHVIEHIKSDFHLHIHSNYYLREIRLRCYQQFLKSYLSVKLTTMANEFGASEMFLDEELSTFISLGRLQCKVDKVNGVVQMNRVDQRNQQYLDIIKKGDLLLNRVQRLSRIISY